MRPPPSPRPPGSAQSGRLFSCCAPGKSERGFLPEPDHPRPAAIRPQPPGPAPLLPAVGAPLARLGALGALGARAKAVRPRGEAGGQRREQVGPVRRERAGLGRACSSPLRPLCGGELPAARPGSHSVEGSRGPAQQLPSPVFCKATVPDLKEMLKQFSFLKLSPGLQLIILGATFHSNAILRKTINMRVLQKLFKSRMKQ